MREEDFKEIESRMGNPTSSDVRRLLDECRGLHDTASRLLLKSVVGVNQPEVTRPEITQPEVNQPNPAPIPKPTGK